LGCRASSANRKRDEYSAPREQPERHSPSCSHGCRTPSGRRSTAKPMAKTAIESLRKLESDFNAFWPSRNKATPARCSPFFQWRIADYLCGKLHFSPEIARKG
jgi:hypothetical protein